MSANRPGDPSLPTPSPDDRYRTAERTLRRRNVRVYRRALLIGFLVSLALHAGVFIVGGVLRLVRPHYPPLPSEERPRPPGLVVIGGEDVEAPAPPREAEGEPARRRPQETQVVEITRVRPEEETEAALPEEAAEAELSVGPGEEEDDALTNAQRLRPQYADDRVWFEIRARPLYGDRLARYARADSAVRSILRDWLDSLQLDEEQRRKALDWTLGEGDERWGISPEGLHLGNVTIPIPFGLAPGGPQRREFEQALRDLQEIQNQELRREIDETREERAAEMRKRSQEEVDRRKRAEETDSTRVDGRPPAGPGFTRRSGLLDSALGRRSETESTRNGDG